MDGDPLADINVVLNHVMWVMKGGVVVVDKKRNEATAHPRFGRANNDAGRRLVAGSDPQPLIVALPL
jgi:hypothetical protein